MGLHGNSYAEAEGLGQKAQARPKRPNICLEELDGMVLIVLLCIALDFLRCVFHRMASVKFLQG